MLEFIYLKFVKKVKLFYIFIECENLFYVFINKIEFLYDECLYVVGVWLILYKEVLNRFEEESLGIK